MHNTVGQQGCVQQNMYNILDLNRTAETDDETTITQMVVAATTGSKMGNTYIDLSQLQPESVFFIEGHHLVCSLGVPLLHHLKLTKWRCGAFHCVIDIERESLHHFLPPSKVAAVSEVTHHSYCHPTIAAIIPNPFNAILGGPAGEFSTNIFESVKI